MDFILHNEPHLFYLTMEFVGVRGFYPILETSKTCCELIKNGKIRILSPRYCDVSDTFEMLLWASSHPNFKFVAELSWYVGKKGDLKMFQFLMENHCKIDNITFYNIARAGHLDLLKYLFVVNDDNDYSYDFFSYTYYGAAQGGYLNILKYMRTCDENIINIFQSEFGDILNSACYHGYFNIINWLFEPNNYYHKPFNLYNAYESACSGGRIDVLEYLSQKYDANQFSEANLPLYFVNNCFCYAAISSGRVEIIQYLLNKGFAMTDEIKFRMCYNLLTEGEASIDDIKWFQDNGIMPIENDYENIE